MVPAAADARAGRARAGAAGGQRRRRVPGPRSAALRARAAAAPPPSEARVRLRGPRAPPPPPRAPPPPPPPPPRPPQQRPPLLRVRLAPIFHRLARRRAEHIGRVGQFASAPAANFASCFCAALASVVRREHAIEDRRRAHRNRTLRRARVLAQILQRRRAVRRHRNVGRLEKRKQPLDHTHFAQHRLRRVGTRVKGVAAHVGKDHQRAAQQHEIVGVEQSGQGIERAEGSQRFAQLERRRATDVVDQLRELEQRRAARLRVLLERGEDRWEDVE